MAAKMKYTLAISRRRDAELRALFRFRGDRTSFETFLIELLEVPHLVDFREQNRKPKTSAVLPLIEPTSNVPRRRRGTDPTIVQIVLLRHAQGMQAGVIARNVARSESTVRRIIQVYEQAATHTRTDIGQCRTRKPTDTSRVFGKAWEMMR
jgi:hypothetical protein